MQIMGLHFGRDVARYGHHGLVAGLGLSEFGDRVIPQIVESQAGQRAFVAVNVRLALLARARLGGLL
jgi:hypothetical protein